MDLVLTSPGGVGGGQTWVRSFASRLAERGHRVRWFRLGRMAPVDGRRPRVEPPEGVQIEHVDTVLFLEPWSMSRAIEQELGHEEADAIVSAGHEASALSPHRLPGRPLHVGTFHHTYPEHEGFRGVLRELGIPTRERIAALYDRWKAWRDVQRLQSADHVIAASQHQRDRAVNAFDVPREKTTVIPLGIDPKRFRPGGRPSGPPTLAFTGGTPKNKGLPDLLDALEASDGPSVRLQIAGDPDGEAAAFARDRTSPGVQVEGLGYPDRSELADALRRASVFVSPSYHESFGLSVAEAMASGLPIVAYDVPAIRELVADGEHGRLVQTGDVDGLRLAIREMLENPDRRREMGQAARARVVERLSWSTVLGQWEDTLTATEARP